MRMNNKKWLGVGLALLAVAGTAMAADFSKQILERQSHYQSIAKNFKAMNQDIKSESPNWQQLKALALQNASSAVALPDLFPEGSSKGSDAKPAIWKNWDKFSKGLSTLQMNFNDLAQVADAKDKANFTALLKKTELTCKGCHRSFRAN